MPDICWEQRELVVENILSVLVNDNKQVIEFTLTWLMICYIGVLTLVKGKLKKTRVRPSSHFDRQCREKGKNYENKSEGEGRMKLRDVSCNLTGFFS